MKFFITFLLLVSLVVPASAAETGVIINKNQWMDIDNNSSYDPGIKQSVRGILKKLEAWQTSYLQTYSTYLAKSNEWLQSISYDVDSSASSLKLIVDAFCMPFNGVPDYVKWIQQDVRKISNISNKDYTNILNSIHTSVLKCQGFLSSIGPEVHNAYLEIQGVHADTKALLEIQVKMNDLFSDFHNQFSDLKSNWDIVYSDDLKLHQSPGYQNSADSFIGSFGQTDHSADVNGFNDLSGSLGEFMDTGYTIKEFPGMLKTITETFGIWFSPSTFEQISTHNKVSTFDFEPSPSDIAHEEVHNILESWR